jgi:tetratricopeptide (TPR) repeat protein
VLLQITRKGEGRIRMSFAPTLKNPYDFRRPVTQPELLIGRQEELVEIRRHLSGSRPAHVALIGERAAGKTSLLNAIERQASELKLIPVRLDLDDSVVASPFTFFKAVFEAAVERLAQEGILEATSPRYQTWHRQVYGGQLDVAFADQLLVYGMVAASALQGMVHPDISPTLLRADCETIASIAVSSGRKGILLLIDEGDLIGENSVLIEKLRNLLQATDRWMLVAAGTKAMFSSLSEVFSPIPRQFIRFPVRPFRQFDQVWQAIEGPLRAMGSKTAEEFRVSFEAARDIWVVTQGRPYEINLVCYNIWEAMQAQEQERFELSTAVLDKVLDELSEIGRQMALQEVAAIRRLDLEDFETAIQVVPYGELTTDQLTLNRLFPSDFTEEEFKRESENVRAAVEDLRVLGILDVEQDRFRLRGDAFVEIYFKYAAASLHGSEHGQHIAAFGRSYSDLMLRAVLKKLHLEVFGTEEPDAVFSQRRRSRELGHVAVGRWLTEFQRGVETGDLVPMEKARLMAYGSRLLGRQGRDRSRKAMEHGLIFVGFVIAVDLDRIEQGELLFNFDGLDQEVVGRIHDWIARNRDVLHKYRIEFVETFAGVLEPSITRDLMLLADSDLVPREVIPLFSAGEFGEAIDLLEQTLEVLGRLGASAARVHGDDYEGLLSSLHNDRGFIAAALADTDTALVCLARALETGNDKWLPTYNLGYVSALLGDIDEAARKTAEAEELLKTEGQDYTTAIMLAHFPIPSDWRPPDIRWNVLELDNEGVLNFLPLQRAVYELLGGRIEAQSFEEICSRIGLDGNPALLRLIGWTLLTVLNRPDEGLRYIESAAKKLGEHPGVTQEMNYMESVTKPGDEADR